MTTRTAKPTFRRDLPERVTWNELFRIADNAARFSRWLDEQNRARKRAGRRACMRTAVTHNALVRAIHDTTKQEGFAAWAQAQDCYIGDLPLVPFASDVRFL